jgi:predicted dehydrogenase
MPYPRNTTRRFFLGSTAAATAGLALARPAFAKSTLDHVHVAVIGAGGRGGELAKTAANSENCEVVAIADPDENRSQKMAEIYGATSYTDLRQVMDDKTVDAVIITTCNHWHCLAAMWAIAAGKHVYVEKPLSHSQWEGRQVVDAAKKSGLVVQIGTQQRSDPLQAEAKALLHDDRTLGAIQFVQANRLGPRGPIGKRTEPLEIPKSVNYDLWLGPAEDQPLYRNNLHYDWHWDWNTGSGEMGNWGVHILDDIRNVVYQDSVSTPRKIVAAGGRVGWNDAGDTPNVHYALFETDSFPTLIALSNLQVAPETKGSWKCPVNGINGPSSGYVVTCENGYYLGQRGRGKAIDNDGKVLAEFKGGNTVPLHVQNFVDAVISGDASTLNGPIDEGHNSTGWCNLANVAFRAAAQYDVDQLTSLDSVQHWPTLIEQMENQLQPYGATTADLKSSPVLTHNPEQEIFVGENADLANPFLKRTYRKGYEIA